jgi:hypothetical protein
MTENEQVNSISGKDIMFIWMFIITIGAVIFAIYSFQKVQSVEPNQESKSQITTTTKTFYLSSTANIRECASTSCDVITTYSKDTKIELPYTSIEELPEWIKLTLADNTFGYINKITLSDSTSSETSRFSTGSYTQSKSDLIKKWSKQVGFLTCYSIVGGENIPIQTASVYVHKFTDGGVRGMTNKHAVENMYGGVLSGCSIDIPGIYYDVSTQIIPHSTLDVAQIILPESEFTRSLQKNDKACYKENITPELGDEILILGYPGIGADSLTVTEGIISGVDYPYFTTSAKIDHGNSGGAAILVDSDCLLGIPTGSVVGEIESLGRILNMAVFGT